MKKLFVLVIMIACAGMAFAQTNAVSLDLYPAIVGIDESGDGWLQINIAAGFEHAMSRNLTVGGDVDFFIGSATGYSKVFFGATAKGRYYPMSQALEGLFVGGGFGIGFTKEKDVDGELNLIVEIETGYKIPISSFFVEPSIACAHGRWSRWEFKPGLRVGFMF